MAAPAHEFRFAFDREFLRAGLRRDYVWRAWFVATVYIALGIAGALYFPQFRFALVGGFGMAGGLVAVLVMRKFNGLVDATFEHWAKLAPTKSVRVLLDDDGFAVEMENGSSRYAWRDLRRLWRYPDVWAIEIVKMQSVLFPPSAAPDAARDFIIERCRAAGIRV